MNAELQGAGCEPVTRERKIELILSNGRGTLMAMGINPDPGMIRRFLEAKDEPGLDEWFHLMLPGGAR